MSDIYAINVAKTEFRDGYNNADVDRVIAVFQDSGFTDMSEGESSNSGTAALTAWRHRLAKLFAEYSVKMNPIIIKIVVTGNSAYDYGWHEFILTPKSGGDVIRKRQRYCELWTKSLAGSWKISMYIANSDVREELNGFASHWFLSEESNQTSTLGAAQTD